MKITIASWDARPAQFEAQASALASHVKSSGADMVLLPEMAFTPWLSAAPEPDQAAWAASVSTHEAQISRLGQALGVAIAGSRPVILNGKNHNQGYLFAAGAFLNVTHEKRALPAEDGYWEAHWYQPGTQQARPVAFGGLRLGFAICTELWDGPHGQALMRAGTEVILAPRATPGLGDDVWVAGARAMAVQTGCYVLTSNFAYPLTEGFIFEGLSAAADPDGALLGVTSQDVPFITVEVSAQTAQDAKQGYPRYIFERLRGA